MSVRRRVLLALLALIPLARHGSATPVSTRQLSSTARLANQEATDALFVRVWTVPDGLGPLFNGRSCAACHARPTPGGSGTDERAFVAVSPSVEDPAGGHVFRRLRVDERGAVTERQRPEGAVLRRAPPLFGLGALERIPVAVTAAAEDAGDRSSDSSAGHAGSGRFGWKARFPTLDSVVAAAFANELGLTNPEFPGTSPHDPSLHRVEISADQLERVAAFVRALPPLAPLPLDQATEAAALATFTTIGCASCHRPVRAASVTAYTDLLLHDMGPALADGIAEGTASGNDFRTPPLWGLSRTGPPYLHDGRASTIDVAIREHGGEAERSAAAYRGLAVTTRRALLDFLETR